MNRLKKPSALIACVLLSVCVIWGLSSCKSLPDLTGTQVLRTGHYQIESLVRRYDQAAYTLVFESGARNCIQRWEKVLQQLPENLNVYLYNRPGYCKSSPAVTARTSENIVNELRDALRQQGFKPPYVLIGHSMGGLYMQHFARQYPDEVQGLVLVDAIYPGVFKNPKEFPLYTRMGMTIFLSSAVKEEIYLASTSSQLIDALPEIDDKPIVRLFNLPTSKIEEGSAIRVDFGLFVQDEKLQEKLAALYPRAKVVVADSSHQMQETSPELVVQAVMDVIHAQGAFQNNSSHEHPNPTLR